MRYCMAVMLLLVGFLLGRFHVETVLAQSKSPISVTLGSATIHIGMSKADALAQFDDSYKVSESFPGSWMVSRKPVESGGVFEILGSFSFSNGRLVGVSRVWVQNQQDFQSFWNGMFNCLYNATKQTEKAAIVTSTSRTNPNSKDEELVLALADRRILINRYETYSNPKQVSYTVDEQFGN